MAESVQARVRRRFLKTLFGSAVMLAMGGVIVAHAATDQVKVVYHLADGIEQASRAMANIRNHLRAAPDTKIVVVALGGGVKFLLRDAVDRQGKPFDAAVGALVAQGVEFRVCNNTLTAHDIAPGRVLPEAKIVPSGVVEVARLQAKEGFVYLRP